MRPVKLTTRAFGPYSAEQVIDFRNLGTRTLFLIHGPTGAGKTTILDAISFALYGVCSGQDRDSKRIRSDHADPTMPTEVTFDFQLGSERYRIFRKPEQPRPKKRGGMTKAPAQAVLWRRTGLPDDADEGTVLASKWTNVTDRVEELLGFRSDQFRQVVMLPQGEFRRLLLADSKQRQEILEVLFQTQLYRRIEETLRQQAKEVRDRIAVTGNRLAFILEQAQAESREALLEQRATLDSELASIRKALLELTAKEKEGRERVTVARQVIEKIRERTEAQNALVALDKRQKEFVETRVVLGKARQAAALVAEERTLNARGREGREANARLEKAREQTRLAVRAKDAADVRLSKEDAKQAMREEARRGLDRLEDLTIKVEELAGSLRSLDKARKELNLRADKMEAIAQASDDCTARLEKVREDLVLAEKTADRIELLEVKFQETEKAALHTKKLSKLKADVTLALQERDRKAKLLKQAEQALQDAQTRRRSLERAWIEGQASILAARLSPGEACPVCGSTHHPNPAHSDVALPDEKALKAGTREVEILDADLGRLRTEAHDQENRVSTVQVEIRLVEESLGEILQRSPSDIEKDRKHLKDELKRARDARQALTRLGEDRVSLEEQQASLRRELAATNENREKALTDHQQAHAQVAARRGGIPEELQGPGALSRAKKSAEDRLRQMNEAFEQAREDATRANEGLTACKAAESAAAANSLEAASRLMTQEENFRRRLTDAGFLDEVAFRDSKKTEAEIERIESSIQDFDRALAAAKDRATRAELAAETLETPDLKGLEQAAAVARTNLNSVLQQEATLAAHLKRVKGWEQESTHLSGHLSELEAHYGVVGRVADVANGNNRERITFQRFVLSALLDDVLGAASSRLRIMSNGRFYLQRVKELADRRTSGGLDLEVYDNYTGTARPVSTLSGGESFLASLSLALGLADVVQAYSGGIQLDAVFVDEGFGSLDPEALDLAMQALMDLQRDGRLVGIISHVPSLREIIDARLEVTAGRSGSIARFVVGCSREG